MTLAQILTIIVLAIWPILFAASFWFFRLPERQLEALARFAPMAAGVMENNKTLSDDAQLQLALVFVTEAFAAEHLPRLPDNIVRAAIIAALPHHQ